MTNPNKYKCSSSELIDLVVKLQEQNLILTRLLARSTLTAANSAPAASNTRLNLQPNVNFTRTKSGSAASRYASDKDFPTLNSGTKKGSATATTSKKSAGTNKKTSKKSSSKTKPPACIEIASQSPISLEVEYH
ncbi:unnamed protein product [Mucor fragilis]